MARVRGDNDQRYALRASFVDENGDVITTDTITISSTATDPRISATQISNWDTAYGWGDHALQNYALTTGDTFTGELALANNVRVRFDNTNDSNYDVTIGSYYDYDAFFQVRDGADNPRFSVGRDNNAYVGGAGIAGNKLWDEGDFSSASITNWDSAYADTNAATFEIVGDTLPLRNSNGSCKFRDLYVDRSNGTGAIYFQNDGSRYLYYDGSTYTYNAAPIKALSGISAFGSLTTTGTITSAGYIMCGTTASSPVGFTVNDGGGNASIVFNDFNNSVTTAGRNAARITHNSDGSANSLLSFQTGSGGAGPVTRLQIQDTTVTVLGDFRATGNITAYYSDERLKEPVGAIEEPLESVKAIRTFYYVPNEKARELGYTSTEREVGVSAQSVQAVMPEAVKPAPVDEEYLTVQYERLVPLLIESIKTLADKVEGLQEQINAIQ